MSKSFEKSEKREETRFLTNDYFYFSLQKLMHYAKLYLSHR